MVAAKEFQDFVSTIDEVDQADWQPDWFKGLQQKYRPAKDMSYLSNIASGEPRKQIGLALDLLPAHTREVVKRTWARVGLPRLSNGQLFNALKTLGDLAKHHGDLLFPGYWQFLVDWNLHFGAQPTTGSDAGFEELIEGWVSTPKPEDKAGSDRDATIMRGLDYVEAELGRPEQLGPTIDEFLDMPSKWLSNGASDGRSLPGTQKTKFATYSASTRVQLHADMGDRSAPHYKVFDKRERGKHRNLISSPWSLFLQMSFVGLQAEARFKKVVPTSLSRDWRPDNWLELMVTMRRKLLVPIDQSKFDHVPSMRVLLRCVDVICKAGTHPRDQERRMVAELIKYRLAHGSLSYNDKHYVHQRGLLSGWRWTSLIGTMVNYAEFLAISRQVGLRTQPTRHVCFQGDDALIAVDDWSDAVRLVRRYMEVLPVNPSKFFVDNKRTEYLRYVLTKRRRFGYFARAAAGLMYANASSGGALDPASLASNWSLLYSRGATLRASVYHCSRDLCGLLRCKPSVAVDLLQTPATVGGLGWYLPGRSTSRWFRLPAVRRETIGGERMVVGTSFDDLPAQVRSTMLSSASMRGANPALARVVAASLAGGVVPKGKARPVAQQRVEEFYRPKLMPCSLARSHSTQPKPTTLLDPMYVAEAVASLDSKNGMLWSEVFRLRDVHWLKARKRNWGAKLFNEWAAGQLSGYVGKVWGDAPDFLAVVRAKVEAEGLIPSGRKSMWRVRTRLLELELASRHWLTDTRKRLGA
jgi:hypothetical protein